MYAVDSRGMGHQQDTRALAECGNRANVAEQALAWLVMKALYHMSNIYIIRAFACVFVNVGQL